MKALKAYVRDQAEQLAMPAEILTRKKEYEALVRSGMNGGTYALPERLRGWRFAIIGQELLHLAKTFDGSSTSTTIETPQ
jgi:ribonuclease D